MNLSGRAVPLVLLCSVAACDGGDEPVQAQRISLDQSRAAPAQPAVSPDTSTASWKVSADGQAVDFGEPDQRPLLTLACRLREQPAQFTIIRHVGAKPGQKALFPVLGNGMVSRFKLDAKLGSGRWRWEGTLPASDPMLEVFMGPRELEATLPGGGTLLIDGSRIPGEFVNWCRAGGNPGHVNAAQDEQDAAKAEAAEASSEPPAR